MPSLLLAAAAFGALNVSHPYWIISTSTSREPNEMLYLTDADRGEGALRGWRFNEDSPDNKGMFWLMPVGGDDPDAHWLVGTKKSRKSGHMVYLDDFGKSQIWPFHPDKPDPKAEWRLVEVNGEPEVDMDAYFIVSGPKSRYKNEM